ncbi:MAG TPA: hypothetical protein VFC43_05520 [Methanoregula sp.]|nr:hypothetical protein [Methanoregula sp.]
MKGLLKWTVLVLLLICCTHAVSAFSVASVSIDPSGSLTPNNPVTVSFKIEVDDFGSDSEIQLFTDLEKPKWTYTIIVNGVENLRPVTGGRIISISGFELSYKTSDEVAVRVSLEGLAPPVDRTTNKTLIRITEYDGNSKAITSTQVEKTALVINTGDVTSTIQASDAELQDYRTQIDEKAALGIDTSAAEAKYNEANQKISSARSRPSNQYAGALEDLNAAKTAIQDGKTVLDKAWAEYEIAAAQVPINNVDAIIGWFKGNSSTANDQELSTIITKREVAVSYISNANDNIAGGNYVQARQKAQEAFAKGNESYTDALARQKQLMSGIIPSLPKINSTVGIIIGVVVVILIIVGVVIYRKRSQWDELG